MSMSAVTNDNPQQRRQRRIMLWGVPRSLSTVFLRAMSGVPDSVVWYEPYLMVQKAQSSIRDVFMNQRNSKYWASSKGYNMFDASNQWVKGQLEGSFPGNQLVFVKEMVEGIIGHFDEIPHGYQHILLIRHPFKVFASFKNIFNNLGAKEGVVYPELLTDFPSDMIPKGRFFKEMCDLYDYIQRFLDKDVFIIDADDLQNDPEGIMRAVSCAVGIDYTDDLVSWLPKHDDVFSNWMAARELISLFDSWGFQEKTFRSTGFGRPSELPLRTSLSDDIIQLADFSMVYYKKLYDRRLIVP